MITIQTVDSALKNVFLEGVINEINRETNPFLTMVQENKRTVKGNEARVMVRYGNQDSVAAGVEGGELPMSNGSQAEIISKVKNLYGTFQISDKAIRSVQNDGDELSQIIHGEMKNLVATAQQSMNRALYGNGLRLLGYSTQVLTGDRTFQVPEHFLRNFKPGQRIRVFSSTNEQIAIVVVTNVQGGRVHYDNAEQPLIAMPDYDRLYLHADEEDVELSGIDSIFRSDRLYNLDPANHGEILPFKKVDFNVTPPGTGIPSVLDEDEIMNFFAEYQEHCQSIPADIVLTNPTVQRAIFESVRSTRTNVDKTELAGGFSGFRFNGLPVYSDIMCKPGTLYALNSPSWAMHQICDWAWFDGDNGGVLKQMDGRAGYTASLVKYGELVCEKPFLQGKVAGYSATRFRA